MLRMVSPDKLCQDVISTKDHSELGFFSPKDIIRSHQIDLRLLAVFFECYGRNLLRAELHWGDGYCGAMTLGVTGLHMFLGKWQVLK